MIQATMQGMVAAMNITEEQAIQRLASHTVLSVSPRACETAKVAAFLASEHARTITGTQVMSEIR